MFNKMIQLDEQAQRILVEELTKSEVRSMIASELSSSMSSRDFEKAVSEISAKVIEKLFKTLWERRTFWNSSINK